MTVRIGKVELTGVQDIYTEETRNLVEQRVPDQKGSIFQDLGRDPVTIVIIGLLFGSEVLSDLEQLRLAQEKADPLPFAADIAIGTELTEVIIEDLKLRQLAGYVDRYRFAIRVREHVAPPESPDKALAAVNEGIAADADAFAEDAIAAADALQDPSNLANILADNPGALGQMSADDLAGAVADHADKLSPEDVGGILKAVGTQDPTKMEGMLTSLKEKGALGGLMEKFATAGKSLKEMLKNVNLTELAKGLVALFNAGLEMIRLLRDVIKKIKDVWGKFDPPNLLSLEGFLKTGIDVLRDLIQDLGGLVEAIDKVVKALKPKEGNSESPTPPKIVEELKCQDTVRKIINTVVDGLSRIEKMLVWLGNLLVDLGGLSGLLEMAVPVLEGGSQFIKAICQQINAIFVEGDDQGSVSDIASYLEGEVTKAVGDVLKAGNATLKRVWEISERVFGLDHPIFVLKRKLGELRDDIMGFNLGGELNAPSIDLKT